MSVIIHGLEMPRNCLDCKIRGDRLVCPILDRYAMNNKTDRRSDCPLVPLPEGHGRLIDAEAVTKTICNSCDGACDVVQCDCINCKADCRCDIVKEISDAHTIIEAEGGNADGN